MLQRRLFNQSPSRPLFGGSGVTLGRGEIDLRAELDELFFGYKSGIKHGSYVLIRRMRRDVNGNKIPCVCKDELTTSADPDCSYCSTGLGDAEGYLWDEDWVWSYSVYTGVEGGLINRNTHMPPGVLRVEFKVFYMRFDCGIKHGDKIVEVALDEEGRIQVPLIRETIYSPQTINRQRSDNSRIEFYSVACRESEAIRLDFPR